MTTYNTSSDSANTMISAFLTKIGEEYLGHSFNTGNGKGKEIWTRIKEKTFDKKCFFWVEQLEAVCETIEDFKIRKKKIFKHMKE